MPNPAALTPEAGMFVLINEFEELVDAPGIRRGCIAMPFEICSHPEDAPQVAGFDIGGFGNGMLQHLAGCAPPARANFEYLHALPGNPETDIQLWTDGRSRTSPFHEGTDNPLKPLGLKFAKRHDKPCQKHK